MRYPISYHLRKAVGEIQKWKIPAPKEEEVEKTVEKWKAKPLKQRTVEKKIKEWKKPKTDEEANKQYRDLITPAVRGAVKQVAKFRPQPPNKKTDGEFIKEVVGEVRKQILAVWKAPREPKKKESFVLPPEKVKTAVQPLLKAWKDTIMDGTELYAGSKSEGGTLLPTFILTVGEELAKAIQYKENIQNLIQFGLGTVERGLKWLTEWFKKREATNMYLISSYMKRMAYLFRFASVLTENVLHMILENLKDFVKNKKFVDDQLNITEEGLRSITQALTKGIGQAPHSEGGPTPEEKAEASKFETHLKPLIKGAKTIQQILDVIADSLVIAGKTDQKLHTLHRYLTEHKVQAPGESLREKKELGKRSDRQKALDVIGRIMDVIQVI